MDQATMETVLITLLLLLCLFLNRPENITLKIVKLCYSFMLLSMPIMPSECSQLFLHYARNYVIMITGAGVLAELTLATGSLLRKAIARTS